MKDDAGVVQLWTVSPNGGKPNQLTRNRHDIASAFTWSADDRWIAHVMNGSVCVTDTNTGGTCRLTPAAVGQTSSLPLQADSQAGSIRHLPRPEACVFSPDGGQIAYVRPVSNEGQTWNQIFVCRRGDGPQTEESE